MLRVLRLMSLLAAAGPCLAVTIPLQIANPGGLAMRRYPVTTGVPFPPGVLASERQVRLLDASGRELPLQAACTGRHRDGSVRWLLLDFQVDLSAGGDTLSLECGPTVQPLAIAEPLRIQETATEFAVDTGPLQVTLDRRQCDGFRAAALGPVTCIQAGHTGGAYFVSDTGQEFRACQDKQPQVAIESQGPLRTVITTRGWYANPAGERKCQFIIRYHFYAGQSYVRVAYTWLMTEDSRELRFRDIGFRLPVRNTGCGFTLEDGQVLSAPVAAGELAGLVQVDLDTYRLLSGAAVPAAQPLGLVTTAGAESACGVVVADFRQLFPKEFSVTPSSLNVHVWPAHGVPNPDRKIEDANLQYLWFAHEGEVLDFQAPEAFYSHREKLSEDEYRYVRSARNANALGLAKTHDLLVVFGKPGAGFAEACSALARGFQDPPACLAAPQWMCDSGVFGAMQPYSPAQFATYEALLSDTFDAERRMEAFTRDVGLWNFGDSHTSWHPGNRRWADAYRTWRGAHHGAPRVPWLLYVRSGDPKYLRYGVRNARHLLDEDFCHYSTPEFEALEYPRGKLKGALTDYKGILHWHSGNRLMDYNSMTDFALWYYHLTGDRWGLEVALDWGEAVKAKFTGPFGYRSGTGTMSALIDLYTETWDESYRPLIDAFFTHLTTKVQNQDGNAVYSDHVLTYWPQYKNQKIPLGAFAEWENYAPWLERYWDLTHSAAATQSLVAWADAYLQGFGDMSSLWATHEYINVLAYAYLATGDPKYLGRGVWELERIVASVNRGEDPLLRGLIMAGQVSLSGYVVQRLPAFMKALAQYGKPVAPDPLLQSSGGFALPFVRTRPTINGKPSKLETTECLILELQDAPFAVTARTTHTYPERLYQICVLAPDGKVVFQSEERVPKGSHDFEVQVPVDGQTGVYRLQVTGEGSLGRVYDPISTAPDLPLAFPLAGRMVPFDAARYFVYVPPGAKELEIVCEPVNEGSVSIQATPPDRLSRQVGTPTGGKPAVTLKLAPAAAQTGQMWELVSSGGYGSLRLAVDGQDVPQVLFPQAYSSAVYTALSAGLR